MTFRVREDALKWFSELAADHTIWDFYYFCLMPGLASGRKRDPTEGRIPTREMIDRFIDSYKPAQQLIIGLLIEAELQKADIDPSEKASVRGVIRRLIAADGPTGLTQVGMDTMNAYASGGYEFLSQSRETKPRSSEEFHRDFVRIMAEAVEARAA